MLRCALCVWHSACSQVGLGQLSQLCLCHFGEKHPHPCLAGKLELLGASPAKLAGRGARWNLFTLEMGQRVHPSSLSTATQQAGAGLGAALPSPSSPPSRAFFILLSMKHIQAQRKDR